MKTSLKTLLMGAFFIATVAAPVMSVVTIATPLTSSVSANAACENRVLGIPPWYRGLTAAGSCDMKEIKGPIDAPNTPSEIGLRTFIWTVVLNVIEMAVVIVAYIAVFFILYGGFQFIVGGSNPGMIEKARKSILNAVIGLVIAMGAIAITNLIFSIIS